MRFHWNVLHCVTVRLSDGDLAGNSVHQDTESFGHKSRRWNLACVFCLVFNFMNDTYEKYTVYQLPYHSFLNELPK